MVPDAAFLKLGHGLIMTNTDSAKGLKFGENFLINGDSKTTKRTSLLVGQLQSRL